MQYQAVTGSKLRIIQFYVLLSGTFARVSLCRDKTSRDYFALKVLAIRDIIKLKQVDHVKNEKMILSVGSEILRKHLLSSLNNCLENQSSLFDKAAVESQRQAISLHVISFCQWRRSLQVAQSTRSKLRLTDQKVILELF